jgi:hypothetical protein
LAVFEQPLLILLFGTLLVVAMAVGFMQSQHRLAAWGLLAALLLVVTAFTIERLVVTPGEQVKRALRTLAGCLEANDTEGVMQWISPQSEALQQEVRSHLRRIHVRSISIKNNLTVTTGSERPISFAEARFNAVATLDVPGGASTPLTLPRFLVVRFRREAGQWKIRSYESFDPRGPHAGSGVTY